jgi:deaminated glutathione amidase
VKRIALIQMTSGKNVAENLQRMKSFFDKAAEEGADLVVFPEMAYLIGPEEEKRKAIPQFADILSQFQLWSLQSKVALCPGTLREPAGDKSFNTCPLITREGKIAALYRKIFLFKATLPDRSYDESRDYVAGENIVTSDWEGLRIGFSICFDLRFPELYRTLKKQGAQMVLIPSAFTVPTGTAHWKTLVQARAIENGNFVIAPGVTGVCGDGSTKYGHSLAVGPWGEILCESNVEEGISYCEIDLTEIRRADEKIGAFGSRRDHLFCTSKPFR